MRCVFPQIWCGERWVWWSRVKLSAYWYYRLGGGSLTNISALCALGSFRSRRQVKNLSATNSGTAILGRYIRANFNTVIYARCSPLAMSFLDTSCFNTSQRHAIDSARHLPNGIRLITGLAATGKTALLVAMVMPFLWASATKSTSNGWVEAPANKSASEYYVEPLPDDHDTDKNDHWSVGVLICAPNNAAVNEIAEWLHTAASKNPKTTHAIVIQLHSVKTEDKVVSVAG